MYGSQTVWDKFHCRKGNSPDPQLRSLKMCIRDRLTAKEQLGHADIKTTLEIYTHLDKLYKRKNMQKLDDFLSGELTNANVERQNSSCVICSPWKRRLKSMWLKMWLKNPQTRILEPVSYTHLSSSIRTTNFLILRSYSWFVRFISCSFRFAAS